MLELSPANSQPAHPFQGQTLPSYTNALQLISHVSGRVGKHSLYLSPL